MDSKNQWNQKSSVQEFGIQKSSVAKPVHQQPKPTQQVAPKNEHDPNQLVRRVTKRNIAIKKSIATNEGTIYETFDPLMKPQTPQDIGFIVKCFQSHFVFSSMNETQLVQLAKSMFYCRLVIGQTIIKQGDGASSFFVLEKGKINVLVDGISRKQLTQGNGFGELALLYNAPRSATCVAMEECFLWGIDRHTFRKSVENVMRSEQEKNRQLLEQVKFFNQLTKDQKDAIAGVLILQKFNQNEIIVNEGDQASSFYIIVEGKCGVFNKEDVQIATLNPKDSFGESALKHDNQIRMMTIKAIEKDTKVVALGKDMITQILGDKVQYIIYKNICKWALNRSKLFGKIPASVQDKLIEGVIYRKFTAGQKVINKGDKVGYLYIALEGNVLDDQKNVIANNILNEESLYDEVTNTKHSQSYTMETEGHVAVIDYDKYRTTYGSVEKLQEKDQSNLHSEEHQQSYDLVKQFQLKELIFLNKLGSGQFGSVYLCRNKNQETLFALKYVTRAHIQQYGIQKHVQQEKSVLEIMNHQFILKFYRSFKDAENIYFLTEYIAGEELFDAIREIGLLGKYDSQFYTAQMILQMEYLHTVHQIVYRDIKPENVMVDQFGYLKLIDMGTAKSLKNVSPPKTFTIIGTPHYMAPEVISGKGYGYFADLWSVGCCLYEFLCGGLPFGEEQEDPFEIYKEIVKNPLHYPSYITDKTAKTIIEQLLNKIPECRLGGSYSSLKNNQWFSDFDWNKLMQRQLQPPLIPKKEKLMNETQIQEQLKKNILVIDQIQKDTMGQKKVFAQPKDAEWDSIF
ncbi:unnamed protein product (macronuclear) [Paramecium tetraurelia]|uniref:cGMP-dependent protein kinase n=1 Tax=Paramecium tetraurelia TaxID=5888 RepID=Q3SEP0_PARTE|nr:uncharacterized protein GSPATT00030979001 [Paramecium tetraurelia]CAH69645.1 cGMP-dependent protein kinase 8-2 [Paramecium tetraurelia]CAK60750.1 unnamed protein product [Paramecium tetraurelia]|eukprot:XP_001428148.1 hypothetical protein (macronuclear) [Paramecium tetraurelia strain d4-2]